MCIVQEMLIQGRRREGGYGDGVGGGEREGLKKDGKGDRERDRFEKRITTKRRRTVSGEGYITRKSWEGRWGGKNCHIR
jgi:hypothetical protein